MIHPAFATIPKVESESSWPESWRMSHRYDEMELWGEERCDRGHAYAYAVRAAKTLDLVRKAKAPPARVLDVAAGQGNFSLALAALGYRVTWNDIREDLAGYVRLKQGDLPLGYLPGNLLDLDPAAVGLFDVVLATEIIEHVAHPDLFLAKLAKFLAPAGAIVLTTPNGKWLRNPLPRFSDCANPSVYEAVQFKPDGDGHIFLFHPNELAALARTVGLRTRHIGTHVGPLTAGALKLGRLLPYLPRSLVMALEPATSLLPRPVAERLNGNLFAVLVSASP